MPVCDDGFARVSVTVAPDTVTGSTLARLTVLPLHLRCERAGIRNRVLVQLRLVEGQRQARPIHSRVLRRWYHAVHLVGRIMAQPGVGQVRGDTRPG